VVVGTEVGVVKSPDEWVAEVAGVMVGFDGSQHLISNAIHRMTDDIADTECFILADHFLNNDSGDRSFTLGGIYTLQSVRIPAGLKICKWHLKVLWCSGNPGLYALAAEKTRQAAAR
jgi:hypothetical protein